MAQRVHRNPTPKEERAGLRAVKFHGLRHSFGTLAVQAFPLSDVPARMGHADIQTTMRYVHHVPKHDAAQRLGRLLDGADVAPNLAPAPGPGGQPKGSNPRDRRPLSSAPVGLIIRRALVRIQPGPSLPTSAPAPAGTAGTPR